MADVPHAYVVAERTYSDGTHGYAKPPGHLEALHDAVDAVLKSQMPELELRRQGKAPLGSDEYREQINRRGHE